MKIKVCGMKYEENIRQIADLKPDYMGFIFYEKSKRFAGDELKADVVKSISGIEKVGVYVNETPEKILEISQRYGFTHAQLHGSESTQVCEAVKRKGVKVIKVFSVDTNFDFSILKEYDAFADYFLFDTATEGHGGSGKKFNWEMLKNYKGTKPYFLSGGIGPDDAEEILKLKDDRIFAMDINSRFESKPGKKDADLVAAFIKRIK